MSGVIAAVIGANASAADITTVTVTSAGPDKTIPTDASFYLAGSAKNASRVLALVVRTGSQTLWGSDPLKCEEVTATLRDRKQNFNQLTAQTTTADQLWKTGNSDWQVKVAQPWVPPDATTTDFKILIDHDSDFFAAGFGYCVYIFQDVKSEPKVDVANAVLAAFQPQACKAGATCTTDHAKIDAAIAKIADAKLQASVRAATQNALGIADNMADEAFQLSQTLKAWSSLVSPYPIAADEKDSLFRATLDLLAFNGSKVTEASSAPPLKYTYKTLAIESVSFKSAASIEVAGTVVGKKDHARTMLEAKTTDLTIPDTGITLETLLQFSQGKLPLDTRYVDPVTFLSELTPALTTFGAALDATKAAKVAAAQASLDSLTAAMTLIQKATSVPDDGSKAAILWQLHDWLYKGPCKSGWDQDMPIQTLQTLLSHFTRDQAAWIAQRPTFVESTTQLYTVVMPAAIQYDRKTWFFSYVMPVVGYAIASPVRSGDHESVTLHYYGLQLHFVPNPDAQPQKGAGIIAVEFGASPGIGTFGPDSRYRGVGNVSPLFLGLGLHIIPYTTLSAGLMFAERRSSTVTQEKYDSTVMGYVGLSVDINIPELVRSAMSGTSTTTGSNTTSH